MTDDDRRLSRGATLVAWLEAVPGMCLVVSGLRRMVSLIRSR